MSSPGTYIEDRVPYARRVFCNRNLRLDSIRFVGFDMDYTLALYHEAMEHLQAEMVLERLVEKHGYPRTVLACKYDPSFAIRGLSVDMCHGNVFKMDTHRFVGRVWHGDARLERERRRLTYTNRRVNPADPDIVMVDTLFSLPEISLYCQLVAWLDRLPEAEPKPTYERLWTDLRFAMDSLHRDGTLKAHIMADVPRFIRADPELPDTLHRFRSAGKRLFVMTNSEPLYTDAVMSHLLDRGHNGYAHWSDYFDFVICSARKPLFFSGDEPFVEHDLRCEPTGRTVTALTRGHIYNGGNLNLLNHLTGMIGDEVLYVGDHIYGDIVSSKRTTTWRTALVVQEMERELTLLQELGETVDMLDRLDQERNQLNLERAAKAIDGERDRALGERVRDITRQIAVLEAEVAEAFNPHWGTMFRDRSELSAFGAQVEDYACVYTSRVSNFRLYSPVWYFRSPRDRMAHELRR